MANINIATPKEIASAKKAVKDLLRAKANSATGLSYPRIEDDLGTKDHKKSAIRHAIYGLEQEGLLERTGEKRGAKWHWVK